MSYDGISIKKLLKGIKHTPLTPEVEKELLARTMQGDQNARDRLVEANQRFVIRMAISYRNQGLSLPDLIQEGNLGLIEAIDRYDPAKECRLISYAAWWIRLYMQRALEQKSRTVTIPINKISQLKKIKNFEYGFIKTHGRKPTCSEISAGVGLDEEKIQFICNMGTSTISIHAEDDDGQSMEDRLQHDNTELLRKNLWLDELEQSVAKALSGLSQKEQDVLRCRFGLNEDSTEQASLRQAGRKLGLSAEGVRQIQAQALAKLRDPEFGSTLRAYV
ncbi:MAG: sigma-70 family RNA polymerase sigma factor [bacterium]